MAVHPRVQRAGCERYRRWRLKPGGLTLVAAVTEPVSETAQPAGGGTVGLEQCWAAGSLNSGKRNPELVKIILKCVISLVKHGIS